MHRERERKEREGRGGEGRHQKVSSPVETQGVHGNLECRELDHTMLAKDELVKQTKWESSKHLPLPPLSPPHLSVLFTSGSLIFQAKSSVLSSEDQERILKMNISLQTKGLPCARPRANFLFHPPSSREVSTVSLAEGNQGWD